MDCMQIRDKLVQYIEGLLTEEEKAFIDNHLAECDGCNKELYAFMGVRDKLIL
ncbi:MAG: zf-HC2 domain-containing protein, partial [Deltaproteobacteria bacterium]|nr:zf-HC2 domain-containing protein [Deltaproteobacteria bacterium]